MLNKYSTDRPVTEPSNMLSYCH